MFRKLALCGALSAAMFISACATNPPSGGGGTGGGLTISQQIDIAKTGLSLAKAGFETFCTAPNHPKFCDSPTTQSQINASYTAAQDALTDVQTLLSTPASDPAAVQKAVDALIQAVNDYTTLVDSFRSGTHAQLDHALTRDQMIAHIRSLEPEFQKMKSGDISI